MRNVEEDEKEVDGQVGHEAQKMPFSKLKSSSPAIRFTPMPHPTAGGRAQEAFLHRKILTR